MTLNMPQPPMPPLTPTPDATTQHRVTLPTWPGDAPVALAAEHYALVERIITRLHASAPAQPTLDELAASVGLSPGYFQRVFTQWAGVSPKRFVQFLGQRHAQSLLRTGATVLDAALGAGLSGPGRLHDSLLTWRAMTPGEIRAGGAGLTLNWGRSDSPLGLAWLAWGQRGLCHLAFEGDDAPLPPALLKDWPHAQWQRSDAQAAEWIQRIFAPALTPATSAGLQPDQPLAVWLRGSPFQIKVWEALLSIPPGHVLSYGALAERIGQPQAQRAVGSALAANRLACLIPCHRVIQSTAGIGQYRWGPQRKAALIALESALVQGEAL